MLNFKYFNTVHLQSKYLVYFLTRHKYNFSYKTKKPQRVRISSTVLLDFGHGRHFFSRKKTLGLAGYFDCENISTRKCRIKLLEQNYRKKLDPFSNVFRKKFALQNNRAF